MYDNLKTKLGMNGLKLAHININGLLNKLSGIKFLLLEKKLDILTITESHLSPGIKDEQIKIAGFNMARKDRIIGNNWGGCLIYYSDTLTALERGDLYTASDIEQVWIDVTISFEKLLIGLVYRLPHDIKFYGHLSITLEQFWLRRRSEF